MAKAASAPAVVVDNTKKEEAPAVKAGTAIKDKDAGDNARKNAVERLRSIVDRIERLEEERKGLGTDIRDIYQEAKSAGFEVKVLRQLIKIRKQDPADVEEEETLLAVYSRSLGM